MESSNPVFKRTVGLGNLPASQQGSTTVLDHQTLEEQYQAPSATTLHTGRMTIDDVITRTSLMFGVLLIFGAAAWTLNLGSGVLLVSAIAALVMGMVLSFARNVRPGFAIAYAALEGLTLGVLSHYYEAAYPGIISQALLGTAAAFIGVLIAYRSKRVQVTPRFTRALMGALVGYMILGLGSMIAAMFGVRHGYGLYGVSGLGLLLAIGGVALASFFLILDFEQVNQMIRNGAPHQEAWRAGFGLMVTIVWLYMEILRLISVLRDNR